MISGNKVDVAILGSGFNAMYSAYCYAKEGLKVALVLDAQKLGGVMRSIHWNNSNADLGVHNLDLRTNKSLSFYKEILKYDLITWERSNFGSYNGIKITDGIEFPNLEGVGAFDLDNLNASIASTGDFQPQTKNLKNLLKARFGLPILEYIENQVGRFTNANLETLSPACLASLNFISRVFYGTDEDMEKLKSATQKFNDAYAVSVYSKKNDFLGSNQTGKTFGYPKGGLINFCEKFLEFAKNTDIKVLCSRIDTCKMENNAYVIANQIGEKIFSKNIFSTLPIRRTYELIMKKKYQDYKNIGGTCLVLFYVKHSKLNELVSHEYINDFSDTALFFRVGAVGIKAEKKSDGIICAEIPFIPNHQFQEKKISEKKIWSRIKELNFVANEVEYHDVKVLKHNRTSVYLTLIEEIEDIDMSKELAQKLIYTVPSSIRGRESFIKLFEITRRSQVLK